MMNTHNDVATGVSTKQGMINVGLSACLAGQEVRYNGGHTQSRLCLETLSKYFTFKMFCPEVAAGFTIPRPSMRLIGTSESPKLVYSSDSSIDLSSQLIDGYATQIPKMAELNGYILMKNSPSCGLSRVKMYDEEGSVQYDKTVGLFARALKQAHPLMPIEEEGRLHDDKLFDNFVLRVFAYRNFRTEVLAQPSMHNLIAFHRSYKYVLMAHNQQAYKALGRMIGNSQEVAVPALIKGYFTGFMQALAKPANKKNHTNTLLHMLGYLKKSISSQARRHILEVIESYHNGLTPLVTPLTLLKHYFLLEGASYILGQRYLEPYPESIHSIQKYCR